MVDIDMPSTVAERNAVEDERYRQELELAARHVRKQARDEQELADFLDMLGLPA